jgi:RNA polymerase sigma-70 factor (ECF subfamily)
VDKFEKLANQHRDTVYRQMIRACGNREDAEDVLVEALLNAYRHLDQLRDSTAFRPWLAKIANRVCWHLKQRATLMPLMQLSALEEEGKDIASEAPPIETQIDASRLKDVLDDAIRQLPLLYREVYELRDIEEMAGEDVARKLGISLAAMKSRLHRARSLLRGHLDEALNR